MTSFRERGVRVRAQQSFRERGSALIGKVSKRVWATRVRNKDGLIRRPSLSYIKVTF